MSTREEAQKLKNLDVEAKVGDDHIFNTQAPSSSRQRSMFRNPRIVRVSRAFGGKDRHSKVTTVKGLRDRRIRLSVPTAIELYDLQERLGLSQPSKVVDWLLASSKDEIDKLPPLQMPPGLLNHFHNPALNLDSNTLTTTSFPYFDANISFFKHGEPQSSVVSKNEIRENPNFGDEVMMRKSKAWNGDSSEQNREESKYDPQVTAQNLFPITSHSFPDFLNNSVPYNSFYHLEPNSNVSLTQFGNNGFQNHVDGGISQSLKPFGSQLYLYPPTQTPSIVFQSPQYIVASSENDARHANMFLPNPFMSPLHQQPHSDEKELDAISNGS